MPIPKRKEQQRQNSHPMDVFQFLQISEFSPIVQLTLFQFSRCQSTLLLLSDIISLIFTEKPKRTRGTGSYPMTSAKLRSPDTRGTRQFAGVQTFVLYRVFYFLCLLDLV